ncbi:type I secretion system permease/ATPase [Amaricoccus macauensis]|uniref:type I secretion system permease/ATPase n=1 Tax=Amaricoccus macauensis TaxID=57001 RepID=UPI003C7EA2EB
MSMQPAADPCKLALRDVLRGAAAAGVVGFFLNILHLALPLYTIQVYDRVLSSGSLETLSALAILVAVVLLFQAVIDFLRSRLFSILGGRMMTRLGNPVFESAVETTLRQGPMSAAGVMRDLSDLRGFIAGGAIALPIDLVVAPMFLLVLFLLHPFYGLVGLAGAIVLTGAALATEMLARRPSARAAAATNKVQTETSAAIRNAEVITAMGMLPAIARRWRESQAAAIEDVERGRTAAKGLAAVARTLRVGFQIGIITTGAILVVNRDASAGTIIAANVLMSRLLLPFEGLIDGWRQWVDALAAFTRIRSVVETGATQRSALPIVVGSGRLAADRATYMPQGGSKPLLRNVSFQVESGELMGVIGPSGAGKSTLARLIVGLWQPSAGGIYLDGQSTFTHERASFGAAVGYLPQEPTLFEASVRDNIARFREAPMEEVVRAARDAGVHELIGSLPQGYQSMLADGGVRLSGGQRQRLALARALFGNPKLLVLDEPNSNLDAEGEAALVRAIEIARERGATVVVVAQRMSILSKADKLLMLRDGAVAQFGSRDQVLAAIGPKRPTRSGEPGQNGGVVAMREGGA